MKRVAFVAVMALAMSAAEAGECVGGEPCRACKDCSHCAYCNSGKGSCSVQREQADREYRLRQKQKEKK